MPPTTESKKTVLIIEDEASLRRALADKCTSAGLAVLEAGDGEKGLQLALSKHPDIILLDLLLPIRDGMSVLAALRTDAWGKTAKVIILSNVSETEKIAEALEHDTFDYFIKSDIEIEEVIKKIESNLGQTLSEK